MHSNLYSKLRSDPIDEWKYKLEGRSFRQIFIYGLWFQGFIHSNSRLTRELYVQRYFSGRYWFKTFYSKEDGYNFWVSHFSYNSNNEIKLII